MTDNIREFIAAHKSTDANAISKEATDTFGKFVPVAEVLRVLASIKRKENVGRAKGLASETLDSKVQVMEHVSAKLLASFNDERTPFKDRIEAAKELRQWTRLGLDVSGIHDAESDTLFVIDQEWSPNRDVN